MAYPTTIYISSPLSDTVTILSDVTDIKIGEWYQRDGWYRDLPAAAGKLLPGAVATTDTPVNLSEIPVYGLPSAAPTYLHTTTMPLLRFADNDEQQHVSPRSRIVRHTGHIIAVGGTVIPQFTFPPALPAIVRPFTAAAFDTTNVVVTATAHGLATGDTVAVSSTTTIPGGLVVTAIYSVVVLSTTELLFRNQTTNAIVDLTSAGVGIHTLALVTRAEQDPVITPNVAGVFRFSDLYRYEFSTVDPR